MKITCQACGAKYTIADDKVRGRKVKIRCKGCSAPIVVDAQQGQPGADPAAPAEDAGADTSMEAAAPSVPPPAEESWSVNLSDTDQRTMTTNEIVAGWRSGLVTTDAFVWKEGMADWAPVMECPELQGLLGPAPAAAQPAAAQPAAAQPVAAAVAAPAAAPSAAGSAARLAGGRSAGAVDLFGGVATAGSEEEEVATSAPAVGAGAALPQAGSTAYGDGSLTGARNENSVLFSLDALKAGASPSASSSSGKAAPTKPGAPPRKGAGEPAAAPNDPFGMGGAADLMNIGGGGSPLFSLNSNQALLTAPAPPEPPPSRATDLTAGGPVGGVAPQKNKMFLIGGAGAAVVLVAVLGFAFSGGKDEETPSASAEKPAASAEVAKTEEKKEEPKAEEKKEEPAPEAAASAAPSASVAASEPAKPSAPSGGGSKPAPAKEKEEPAPEAAAGPFNKSAAVAQLTAASNSAQSCKKPGGPTGSGKVQVTFAPSGRVTSANVAGGPFAGTPTGGCVASKFRKAKIPPFSGGAITVSKSFMIN